VEGSVPGVQACLAARYEFEGSNVFDAWNETCHKYGNDADRAVKLSAVAEQLDALLDADPSIAMLTGHSLGCMAALSVGHIRGIPVVCFSASGSFSKAWLAGYPGLAAATASVPYPRNVFALQYNGDPLSMCLTPRWGEDSSRTWAAASCLVAGWAACDVYIAARTPQLTRLCVQSTQTQILTVNYVNTRFARSSCTDFCPSTISVCPYLPPPPPLNEFCQEEDRIVGHSKALPSSANNYLGLSEDHPTTPPPLDVYTPEQHGFPSARLYSLVSSHNVTTVDLALMAAQAYSSPHYPASTGSWRGVARNTTASILPTALYEHISTGKRIAALQGINIAPDTSPAQPGQGVEGSVPGVQACLAARYEFEGSNVFDAWNETCHKYGNDADRAVKLSAVAEQLDALLDADPSIAMLTGHSLGCMAALSVGHIRGIPVVCFSASGSFSKAWLAGYPGLAAATASVPYPRNVFALQYNGDPLSMCLTPRWGEDSSRTWAAASCTFGVIAACSVFVAMGNGTSFDHMCVQQRYTQQLTPNAVPLYFSVSQCTDFCPADISVCPYLSDTPAPAAGSFCAHELNATGRVIPGDFENIAEQAGAGGDDHGPI